MEENKNKGGEFIMEMVFDGMVEVKHVLVRNMTLLTQYYGASDGNLSAILLNKPIKVGACRNVRTINAVGTDGKTLVLIDVDGESAEFANKIDDVHLLMGVYEEVLATVRKHEIGRILDSVIRNTPLM